jgi:multisubunit Na+/H+ antiporter MnhF subunit
VSDGLQIALTVLSLLVALLALVYVVRDRAADRVLVGAIGVLWLGTIVQLVVGLAKLPGADDDVNGVVFVLYLLGLVATPPVAAWWARGEPSRAGSGVVVVAGLLVPFLLIRLDTLWGGGA